MLVETLFQANLLRAVFATETLAAGVNMPARTTVISVISKRGDNGIAPLAPSSLLQMSGRAGRRGMDELGNVVVCRSPYEDATAARELLLKPADAIASHFFVSYGSALKMLRSRPPDECRALVEASFGAYLADEIARREATDLERLEAEYSSLTELLAAADADDVGGYVKLSERLRAEERAYTYLREQEAAYAASTVETLLPYMR